jgi:hypothetical protein
MSRCILFSVAVATSAVLVGCGGKGGGSYQPKADKTPPVVQVSPGKERMLFPMAVGNQWVYDVSGMAVDNQGRQISFSGEVTWKVTKVEPAANGGTRATIDVSTQGKRNDQQVWMVDSKGLFQLSIGLGNKKTNFTPALPAIVFPVEPGREFNWKGIGVRPGLNPGSTATKSKIIGTKQVDVVTGPPMSAIEVKTDTDFGKSVGSATSSAYFAPNVGIIRYVHEVRSKQPTRLVLRLKSHRFPNVSK